MANSSHPTCLVDNNLAADVNHVVSGWIYLLQFFTGLIGNAINLMILLSRQMRSETNTLLACVATADIIFLVAGLPVCIRALVKARTFTSPIVKTFMTGILYCIPDSYSVQNLFSVVSIW